MVSILALSLVAAQGFDVKFIPTGMTAKMGGYMPVRAQMSSTDPGVAKKPDGLTAASYGKIPVGGKDFLFILDEPAGGAARLFVDSNGDGDLTNDPATTWSPRKQGEYTMYSGTAQVTVNGQLAGLGVYRFDKNDPQRLALKDTLLYYTDFGYEGKGKFGKDSYTVAFTGAVEPTTRLWVDRNGNGKNDGRSESIVANKPFNFGGTTYELKITDGKFEAVKSSQTVAEIPLPPDLAVGRNVPTFKATAMDGGTIDFPKTYKGKVVMLDFWATWCGPCIAELPNVLKAYEKFHDRGFEVLGISFDQPNQAEKVASFTKEKGMSWRHVYEGKFWETTLGQQFGVEAIPFCLLVDGSTGKILANVDKLRGENLEKTLEEVFAKR